MRILSGFLDTRGNKEDFALTPYLLLVLVNNSFKIYGIGICWGYYSFYVGIGFNVPKHFPTFKNYGRG